MPSNSEPEATRRVKAFVAYVKKAKPPLANELLYDEFVAYLSAIDPLDQLKEVDYDVICELRKVHYDGGVYIPVGATPIVDLFLVTLKAYKIPEWPSDRPNPTE